MEIFDWQDQDVFLISEDAKYITTVHDLHVKSSSQFANVLATIISHRSLPYKATRNYALIHHPHSKSHKDDSSQVMTVHQYDTGSLTKFSFWELQAQNWYNHRDNHKLLLLWSCVSTSSAAVHPLRSLSLNNHKILFRKHTECHSCVAEHFQYKSIGVFSPSRSYKFAKFQKACYCILQHTVGLADKQITLREESWEDSAEQTEVSCHQH